MADVLPTPSLSYTYHTNNTTAATGTALATNQSALLAIKNTLVSSGSNPWTVVGSSDGVTAGMDGVDRWVTSSNLNWAVSGAHSWIVLKQTSLTSNFQICIDLLISSASSYIFVCVFSVNSGFTGGTSSARPTATDQRSPGNVTWGGVSTDAQITYHYIQSTNGYVNRVFVFSSGRACGIWDISRVKNPVEGFTYPVYCLIEGSTSADAVTLLALNANQNSFYYDSVAPAGAAYRTTIQSPTTSGSGQMCNLTNKNLINDKYPLYPMALYQNTTYHGTHGYVYDMWFGAINATASGDAYPNDGSKQFMHMHDVVIPWNGTTLVTA
jgi:hypothetical protein